VSIKDRLTALLATKATLLAALKRIQSQCAGHADEFSERVYHIASEALQQAEAQTWPEGWQPIETAPKDGTTILGWDTIEHVLLFWHDGAWRENALADNPIPPTHWMPLPAPPAPASQETEAEGRR